MDNQARLAQQAGSQILIFPEMFLTGYNIGPVQTQLLAQTIAAPVTKKIEQIASKNKIAILYGFPELFEDRVYNSALLINENGKHLSIYRKSHLFGDVDRNSFSPGEAASVVIEFQGIKIGILICYDVEFAENVRHLALNGAQLVIVPTALMNPFEFVATTLIPTRAYENQVYLAYANRCDQESELDYCGLSVIVAPDGRELARADERQRLISADIDLSVLDNSRKINTHLDDRRPQLYQSISKMI